MSLSTLTFYALIGDAAVGEVNARWITEFLFIIFYFYFILMNEIDIIQIVASQNRKFVPSKNPSSNRHKTMNLLHSDLQSNQAHEIPTKLKALKTAQIIKLWSAFCKSLRITLGQSLQPVKVQDMGTFY